MDDFVNKLLSEKIDVVDVIDFLKGSNTSIAELRSYHKSELIPNFVDFIKGKCSWMCNTEKSNDLSNNIKQIPSSPNSHINGATIDKQGLLQTPSPLQHRTTNSVSPSNGSNLNEDKTKPHKEGKRVQIITLGCTPYKQKNNSRYIHKSPDLQNYDNFPSKENNRNYGQPFNNSNNFMKAKNGNYNERNFARACDNVPKPCDKFNSDAFPPLGAKVPETKTRRRITPTPIQTTQNYPSKFGKSNFSPITVRNQCEAFKTSTLQESDPGLQQERELLKVTKSTYNVPTVVQDTNSVKPITEVKAILKQIECPDPQKITKIDEILRISEVYSFILSNYLVPNVTSELYFLLELSTTRSSVEKNQEENESDVFATVHNCVYFAASVLERQGKLLQMLDKATITSLTNIPHLMQFSPQLVTYLLLCFDSKQDITPLLPSLTSVPFQVEDDSKVNFPDEYTFVCFKRQRDLFYEMLREWHENTTCVDVKFQGIFLRKARQLISLNPSSINMFHLARLFQSQLVASCMCLEVNEVYDELLNDIQKNFPDKFKKLQERFLTPSCVGGLAPRPSFYGIQIFFAELVLATSSPSLNQHLINILVTRVLELNNTDIFSDGELSSLGTIRDKYVFLLHTLRLLGKFLGYLYFLPYGKEELISSVAKQQLVSRKNASLPLNPTQILKDSIEQGHTVLTVPWVVEFISMVDPAGKNIKEVLEVLKVLMAIYRYNSSFISNIQSQLFLRVIIGWLFDVLHYQDNFYAQFQIVDIPKETFSNGIDSLSIIDKQLIHSCCPYLIEFKVLIHNFISGVQDKKREIRKITPLSTTKSFTSKNAPISVNQLEHRLEENFFFLHPSSVKKTTEFVAERLASKIIGKIRAFITSKKKAIAELVSSVILFQPGDSIHSSVEQKSAEEILGERLIEAFKETKNLISILTDDVNQDIDLLMPTLLSEDTKPKVIEMCCKIAYRLAVDKIFEWCNANLLPDAIKSDIENKIQHITKSQPEKELTENFNLSVWLNEFRSTVVKVHSKTFHYDPVTIITLIQESIQTLIKDIPNSVKNIIFSLSIDFYIALLVNHPIEFCEKVEDYFVTLWPMCPKKLVLERQLMSPQNLKFFATSENVNLSITKFVCLVEKLLKKNAISFDVLQGQVNDLQKTESSMDTFDLLKKQIDKHLMF